MLEIGEHHILSFARADAAGIQTAVLRYWQSEQGRLGLLGAANADAAIADARVMARDVGVDEDDAERIFLLAAAKRLLPAPTPRQLILLLDEVFSDASVAQRVAAIDRLRSEAAD